MKSINNKNPTKETINIEIRTLELIEYILFEMKKILC